MNGELHLAPALLIISDANRRDFAKYALGHYRFIYRNSSGDNPKVWHTYHMNPRANLMVNRNSVVNSMVASQYSAFWCHNWREKHPFSVWWTCRGRTTTNSQTSSDSGISCCSDRAFTYFGQDGNDYHRRRSRSQKDEENYQDTPMVNPETGKESSRHTAFTWGKATTLSSQTSTGKLMMTRCRRSSTKLLGFPKSATIMMVLNRKTPLLTWATSELI